MQDKLNDLDMKIASMNVWIEGKTKRDAEVEQYLQEVHRRRPEEAQIVESAFTQVAYELLELRAAAGGAARPAGVGASASSGVGGTGAAMAATGAPLGINYAEFQEVKGQLGGVQAAVAQISTAMQGKCHCVHVDLHDRRLTEIDGKLQWLEGNLQQVYAAAAAQSSVAAAGGAETSERPPCGPCGVGEPWQHYLPTSGVPSGPPGMPGAGDSPWYLATGTGGNR